MPLFKQSSRLRGVLSTPSFRFLSHHQRLEDAGPLACRLRARAVVRLRGPDTLKFLQSLVTNDVRPLAIDGGASTSYAPTPNLPLRSPPPIYAAILTPEGRFLYDLFLYRQPRPEEKLDRTGSGPGSAGSEEDPLTVLADVDAAALDDLLHHLKKCRLRAKVDIESATEEFFCWQRFGADLAKKISSIQDPEAEAVGWGSSVDHAGESAAQGDTVGWRWFKDPRLDSLGLRGLFPSNIVPPLVESDKEADERHYCLWRLKTGVAEGSTEIPKGVAIPLEYNLAGLNAIAFDKGCYIGQELVARTHHRGVIRKRLLPMKFVDDNGNDAEQDVSPGSEVIDLDSRKKVGTVTMAMGCHGIGPLRLDAAFKQSATLSIEGKDGMKVKVTRPDWWPSEWTQVTRLHDMMILDGGQLCLKILLICSSHKVGHGQHGSDITTIFCGDSSSPRDQRTDRDHG